MKKKIQELEKTKEVNNKEINSLKEKVQELKNEKNNKIISNNIELQLNTNKQILNENKKLEKRLIELENLVNNISSNNYNSINDNKEL